MNRLTVLAWLLLTLPSSMWASTITSGTIVATASFSGDTNVSVTLTSAEGGYTFIGGVEGGVSAHCSGSQTILCSVALLDDVNDNPFGGALTLHGVSYPNVFINADPILATEGSAPNSVITAFSTEFLYTGAGTYSVPFTLSNELQAAVIVLAARVYCMVDDT